ncbi:MAG: thioesterase [Prevotella sp.]|nr:thioesterase [Prevotella sp.]MCM1074064.1 thioesterase [Ruminococcus sp.]
MNKTHQHTYFLTAGECDATGSMPLPLICERLIEVATEHANILGIGYSRLIELGIGWVLSRMSVEIIDYPRINDKYTVTTWIENINRRFSERNMMISDSEGRPIGYARTVWVAIDFLTRTMGDLSEIIKEDLPTADLPCPIEKMPRLTPPGERCAEFDYIFRYCDLDFNRHVNTVRYIELLLNRWPLEQYDNNFISRFDIAFAKECHFHETVTVRTEQDKPVSECELLRTGEKVVSARIAWTKRAERK